MNSIPNCAHYSFNIFKELTYVYPIFKMMFKKSGSIFLQDKMELDKAGTVINLGVRWDFLISRDFAQFPCPIESGSAVE